MSDLLPVADLFRACVEELELRLIPLHYKELTRLAMLRIGLDHSHCRLAERVREKLLQARAKGTLYLGAPLYSGALSRWFTSQRTLSDAFPVEIPLPPVSVSIAATHEALMRKDYMLTKKGSGEARWMALARGMVIEHCMLHYFKLHWPNAVSEPLNYRQWSLPCNHDFVLRVGGRPLLVDVWGPDKHGVFSFPALKQTADLHLNSEIRDNRLFWVGCTPGSAVHAFSRHSMLTAEGLVVRLNMDAAGFDPAVVVNSLEKVGA